MAAATVVGRETRSDEEIQHEVLEELKWDPRVMPNEIGVIVTKGIVTLTGWVDSYAKRWAAEEASQRVRGVKAVANEIEVRLPGSAERTDTEIAEAARLALEWDASVPADRITIIVSKGWVTLKGEVDWHYQRRDAERVVSRLAGVKGVTNLINVKRPAVSPSELKAKIEGALLRSVETDAKRIGVEVSGNKVILRGAVRSIAEKEEAERVAWSAPGVAEVENLIAVTPP